MFHVHPIARTICTILFILAAFLAHTIQAICLVYLFLWAVIVCCRVIKPHIKFVFFVTTPLLIALLIIWGWVADNPPSAKYSSGLEYGTISWLRVVISGGALQSLMLPLIEKPVYLKGYMEKLRLPAVIGTLILSSIFFLPEVQRRLKAVADARKAQGYPVSGWQGLRALPIMLMPLVSSLLVSSISRGELWSHRGILTSSNRSMSKLTYNMIFSLIAIMLAITVLLISVWL